MKKNIVSMLFLMLSGTTFSQQTTNNAAPATKSDYLQKSKSQKTTGWILLGVGVTCIGIAAPGNVSLNTVPILVIGGGAAVLGSVFSFLSASKNKKRADKMTASFKMETRSSAQHFSIGRTTYPAISVRVSL